MTRLAAYLESRIHVILLATAFFVFALAGCAAAESTTRTTATTHPDGTEVVVTETRSKSAAVLSDEPSEAKSHPEAEARAGGKTPPDAATVLMRPVVMAGIGLLIIGGLLTIARMKFPIVPLGASLGVAGLGLGMIVLGAFVASIAPYAVWIIAGAIVVAAITFGPGLIANMKDRLAKEN